MEDAGCAGFAEAPDCVEERLHVDRGDDEVWVAPDACARAQGVDEELEDGLAPGLAPPEEVRADDEMVLDGTAHRLFTCELGLAIVRERLGFVVLRIVAALPGENGVGRDVDHSGADVSRSLGDRAGGDDIDGVGLLGVVGGGLVPRDRGRVQDDVGPDFADEAGHLGGVAEVEGDDSFIER